jgi:hypothetical protein
MRPDSDRGGKEHHRDPRAALAVKIGFFANGPGTRTRFAPVMRRSCLRLFGPSVAALWLLAAAGCASLYFHDAGPPPAGLVTRFDLADWPWREYWQAVVFNGEKIGFSHLALEPLADAGHYRLRSQAAFRLRFLGVDKRVALQAEDVVDERLQLLSFAHRYELDGRQLLLEGRVEDGALLVRITNAGQRTEERHALAAPVYPASAIALYPLRYGLVLGARYRYLVYDGQTQRLAEVEQRIEAYERSQLFTGEAYRVLTTLHGQRTQTWMDARGRPLLEMALNGILISALEDEARARSDLLAASFNKRESLLDWSLVRVARALPAPRQARRLVLVLTGLSAPPPSDARQRCRREAGGAMRCEIGPPALKEASAASPAAAKPVEAAEAERYLAPSVSVPSHDARIRTLAAEIASGSAPDAPSLISRLLEWIAGHIRQEAVDVFSALDVLETRRAECQGHSYLYAAFARALGLPTRVVNGLVYSEAHGGFLYHSWAETLVDGRWLAVDPTFGQLGVDATHLKLLEGERLGDLVPLVETIGQIQIEILEYEAAEGGEA